MDVPKVPPDGQFLSLISSVKIQASHVRTIKARPASKNIALEDKLPAIEGTIEVDKGSIDDDVVLLVDDLYQSGVTMNCVAMMLLEAGVKKVFGLSCEKTCSNDDNVSRR